MADTKPEKWTVMAVRLAMQSTCVKSKRGVVVLRTNGSPIGLGFNHLPGGLVCAGDDACREACSKLCVHAEVAALRNAVGPGPLEVIHIKAVDGRAVPSDGPSCWQCARDMREDGRVELVWLLEDSGWRRYTMDEFYYATMRTCELPSLHPDD